MQKNGDCAVTCAQLQRVDQKHYVLPGSQGFIAYAMMFGNPQYKTYGIPRRKPLKVTWQ